MTTIHRIILVLTLLTSVIGAARAQSGRYDTRLILKQADCPGQKVSAQLQIRATAANTAFKLSDATLRLSFLLSELANPVLLEETNFSVNAPVSDAAYDAQIFVTQTGITKGAIGLTLVGGTTPAALRQVGTDWITVAVIGFDVVKPRGCFNLSINTTDDFPASGVSEAYLAGSSYAYTDATASGVFEKLSACLGTPASCLVISYERIR